MPKKAGKVSSVKVVKPTSEPPRVTKPEAAPIKQPRISQVAKDRAGERRKNGEANVPHKYKAPTLMKGVVPDGVEAPVLAMDEGGSWGTYEAMNYLNTAAATQAVHFPGYPYLAQLATRAEYRNMADALATEMTREWIEFKCNAEGDDAEAKAPLIKQLEDEFKKLDVRGIFKRAITHDAWFGRAQIYPSIKGHNRKRPLILSPATIRIGSLERISTVEAMWTTPSMYNALDPAAADFYKPLTWFMLGQEVHASRLMTIVTRPVSDMLKPAFNFSGLSLSQIAEPYVTNWLRTRQSVSDLISNFSTTALKTNMTQVLSGAPGDDIYDRADMFTATRSNRGLMLLDKDQEELVQQNVPLSGLDALQAQSQEHMCSVSRIPAMILTGISPSGLNASSEGELRAWNDWIAAQQDTNWLHPLLIIMKIVMLHLWGEIDESITAVFKPLHQLTPLEESTRRMNDSTTATNYVNAAILDPTEVRQNLANDPMSGYAHIDPDETIEPPQPPGGPDMFGQGDPNGAPPGNPSQATSGQPGTPPADPDAEQPEDNSGDVN